MMRVQQVAGHHRRAHSCSALGELAARAADNVPLDQDAPRRKRPLLIFLIGLPILVVGAMLVALHHAASSSNTIKLAIEEQPRSLPASRMRLKGGVNIPLPKGSYVHLPDNRISLPPGFVLQPDGSFLFQPALQSSPGDYGSQPGMVVSVDAGISAHGLAAAGSSALGMHRNQISQGNAGLYVQPSRKQAGIEIQDGQSVGAGADNTYQQTSPGNILPTLGQATSGSRNNGAGRLALVGAGSTNGAVAGDASTSHDVLAGTNALTADDDQAGSADSYDNVDDVVEDSDADGSEQGTADHAVSGHGHGLDPHHHHAAVHSFVLPPGCVGSQEDGFPVFRCAQSMTVTVDRIGISARKQKKLEKRRKMELMERCVAAMPAGSGGGARQAAGSAAAGAPDKGSGGVAGGEDGGDEYDGFPSAAHFPVMYSSFPMRFRWDDLFLHRGLDKDPVPDLWGVLPASSGESMHPYNWSSCAVVGNSGALLGARYGADIDGHSAVFRVNQAPTKGRYASHVGSKTTARLLNHMWTRRYGSHFAALLPPAPPPQRDGSQSPTNPPMRPRSRSRWVAEGGLPLEVDQGVTLVASRCGHDTVGDVRRLARSMQELVVELPGSSSSELTLSSTSLPDADGGDDPQQAPSRGSSAAEIETETEPPTFQSGTRDSFGRSLLGGVTRADLWHERMTGRPQEHVSLTGVEGSSAGEASAFGQSQQAGQARSSAPARPHVRVLNHAVVAMTRSLLEEFRECRRRRRGDETDRFVGGGIPTSGLVAVYAMINTCERVSVYGFGSGARPARNQPAVGPDGSSNVTDGGVGRNGGGSGGDDGGGGAAGVNGSGGAGGSLIGPPYPYHYYAGLSSRATGKVSVRWRPCGTWCAHHARPCTCRAMLISPALLSCSSLSSKNAMLITTHIPCHSR
eukprot:jgi/Mesvir1/337/Mv22743-RA.3